MSKNVKLLLACAVLLVLVASMAYAAYIIGTIPGTVEVKEPITWTPTSFNVSMFANESKIVNITVTNAANASLTVWATATITPATQNVTVTVPSNFVVNALSNYVLPVVINATADATPGNFTVSIALSR